jgi:hypothetical protein
MRTRRSRSRLHAMKLSAIKATLVGTLPVPADQSLTLAARSNLLRHRAASVSERSVTCFGRVRKVNHLRADFRNPSCLEDTLFYRII